MSKFQIWKERLGDWFAWLTSREKLRELLPAPHLIQLPLPLPLHTGTNLPARGGASQGPSTGAGGAQLALEEVALFFPVDITSPALEAGQPAAHEDGQTPSPEAAQHTAHEEVQPVSHGEALALVVLSTSDSAPGPGRDKPPGGTYPSGGGGGSGSQMTSGGDKHSQHQKPLEENRLPTLGRSATEGKPHQTEEGKPHQTEEGKTSPQQGEEVEKGEEGGQAIGDEGAHQLASEEVRHDDVPLSGFVVDMGGTKPH